MHVLNVNIGRLSSKETVRYNGPSKDQHGTYTMTLIPRITDLKTDPGTELLDSGKLLQIHMSLEALLQLQQRINAALQHMISH